MSGLKLKWDASGGKTIRDGSLVLVGLYHTVGYESAKYLLYQGLYNTNLD